MAANTFSTRENMVLPSSYLNLSNTRLNEVFDTTIHLDLINPTEANGTLFNHTVFGDMGSKNKNIFYFKNRTKPTIIV